MLKKTVCVLLCALIACCCLTPAAAAEDAGVITLRINSDIAGSTARDTERLIEVVSGNVVPGTPKNSPVHVSDYAGTPTDEILVAGRAYNIRYNLSAAEGFELPEKVTADNVKIECGKGADVYHVAITKGTYREESGEPVTYRGLQIYAVVTVDGNAFQRLIGWIHDLILKIRAWSLY